MARFTKTNLDDPDKAFIGWDDAPAGAISTEATHATDVGVPLSEHDAAQFATRSPATMFTTHDRIEYFREW